MWMFINSINLVVTVGQIKISNFKMSTQAHFSRVSDILQSKRVYRKDNYQVNHCRCGVGFKILDLINILIIKGAIF